MTRKTAAAALAVVMLGATALTTTDAFARDELLAGNKTALMIHGSQDTEIGQRLRGAADVLLERLALHALKHDVGPPPVLAGVDHTHDVRVRELRDRPRLAPEALQLVGVG